jgi:hypothetical protein
MNSTALQIIVIVLSAAASIISSLVLFNINGFLKRVESVESELKSLRNQKPDCQREFVSAEQFVRNESYTRQKLDNISIQVSELAGSLKIVEQMPNICANIASSIVEKMKG